MAGLQTIIDNAETIEFNRRKVVGIQYTRSEVILRNETVTKNPWRLTVTFPAYLPYATNRDLIEALDTLDRKSSETITMSNMTWLLAYQGDMSSTQRNNLTVSDFTGNQLRIGNLPVVDNNFTANKVMFKAGDYIQIAGKPYPFTVTSTVLRGTDSTITVTTHRPNLITGSVTGLGFNVGNAVQFKMLCPNMPTYTVIPGRYIVFNDAFQLYEDVGAA
jgi:translation elongation factor P/translation initiation factor 5A